MKICPIWGNKLIEEVEGSSLIIKCIKCDYSAATSNISLIYVDETIYMVTIENGNSVKMDVIAMLKTITELSTFKMINVIKAGCPYDLYAGKAVEVKELQENFYKMSYANQIIEEIGLKLD